MIVPKLIFQGLENIPIAKANRLLQYPPGMYQYVKKKKKKKKTTNFSNNNSQQLIYSNISKT